MPGFLSGGRNTVKLRQMHWGHVRYDVSEACDGLVLLTCPICQSVCSAHSEAQALDGLNIQIISLYLSYRVGGGKRDIRILDDHYNIFMYIEGLFKFYMTEQAFNSFSKVIICYFLIKYSIAECTRI